MGPTPDNDVGIYDDAMFYVTEHGFLAENANTDPSRYGWNRNANKPMASLQIGCWPFRVGPHKGRMPAARQMTEEEADRREAPNRGHFTVDRIYGKGDPRNYSETGYFAINIHPGGNYGTSSEGCQTVVCSRADIFLGAVVAEVRRLPFFWYLLVPGPII